MYPRTHKISKTLAISVFIYILIQDRIVVCEMAIQNGSHGKQSFSPRNLTENRKMEIWVNTSGKTVNAKMQHGLKGASSFDSSSLTNLESAEYKHRSPSRLKEYSESNFPKQFKRNATSVNTTMYPFAAKEEEHGLSPVYQNNSRLFRTVNISTYQSPNTGRTQNPYSIEYSRGIDETKDDDNGQHSKDTHVTLSLELGKSWIEPADKETHEPPIETNTNGSEDDVKATSSGKDLDPKYQDEESQRRNVSSLLDFLMRGYDKRLRPGFGGKPVVVKTDIVIRSMGPISEKDMIYSMDCYFRQKWTDHRLSFNASQEQVDNVTLNVKMLDRIWKPDTIFINGGHSYIHTITTPNMFFRLSHDGSILYSQRLTIKAHCPMHLEKFPMDSQQCPLHIGSFGYSEADVHYEWHYGKENAAIAADDMRMSQFDLKGMPACNMTRFLKGTQHSVLIVYFDFRRHTGYFLIQVYLPCCLLVVLSWVSFWINREATSERISLGATTMLTLTLIVLDTRNDLPRVTYPTALDIYVAMCFSFIFASIVQFAAVHFFTKYGTADEDMLPFLDSEDEDDQEDESTFDIPNSRTVDRGRSSSNSMTACLKKMWWCIKSTQTTKRRFNKNVRSSLGLNSVSKIDKVSRIIFPAAFSGFNIVYWMSYL